MLGVSLFDADVLDQKRPGKVVLHLYQPFGEELGEVVDERIQLQDPSLHLLDAEAAGYDGFRPRPVDESVPMRGHELVHRRDPPGVRRQLTYRTGVHRLLLHIGESAIEPGSASFACRSRGESGEPLCGCILEAGVRNGLGGEMKCPCAKSTPISRSAAKPASPSTDSPIVFLPISCPTSLIARTIAKSTESFATSLTKLPSILM